MAQRDTEPHHAARQEQRMQKDQIAQITRPLRMADMSASTLEQDRDNALLAAQWDSRPSNDVSPFWRKMWDEFLENPAKELFLLPLGLIRHVLSRHAPRPDEHEVPFFE